MAMPSLLASVLKQLVVALFGTQIGSERWQSLPLSVTSLGHYVITYA